MVDPANTIQKSPTNTDNLILILTEVSEPSDALAKEIIMIEAISPDALHGCAF